jgi:hypothetical protein
MKRVLLAAPALLLAGCATEDLQSFANGLTIAAAELDAELNACPPGMVRYYDPSPRTYPNGVNTYPYADPAYPYGVSAQPASWCQDPNYTYVNTHDRHHGDGRRGDRDYRDGYRDGYEDGRDDDHRDGRSNDRRRDDRD